MRCAPAAASPTRSATPQSKLGAAGCRDMSVAPRPARYDAGELAADRLIHPTGLALGGAGALPLLGLAARTGAPMVFLTSLIYAASLLAMLGCSARYHLTV